MLAVPLLVSLFALAQAGDPASVAIEPAFAIAVAPASPVDGTLIDTTSTASVNAVGVSASVGGDQGAAQDASGAQAVTLPAPIPWTSRGLLDVVPEDTSSAFQKISDARSALADGHLARVAQAFCDAHFDGFVFDTLDKAGAPPELVTELRGYRNLFSTFGGAIPWDELLGHEFVYAESTGAAFGAEGMPAMLLACRPGADGAADAERSLAMVFGALTAASPIHARLDIDDLGADGLARATRYAVRVPLDDETTVLQFAVCDDTLLMGLGERYFGQALALLRGGTAPRLLATRRFQLAVAPLPEDVSALKYVDVKRQVDTVEDVVALVQRRAFASGFWQSTLNDALELYRHIETVATTARCVDDEVVLETVTRFDPEATRANPWYQAGLAKAAAPELLDYVPADAVSFEMRGDVDVLPIYRAMIGAAEDRYDWAGPVFMACRVLGAAADFSLERDVLSWVGSQHLNVTMPSRAKNAMPGATDSVTLWKLADPSGVRKCLARLEAVYQVLVPPLLADLHETLTNIESPFVPDLQLREGGGLYASLHTLELSGLPFAVPPLSYGVLGDSFVLTTSQNALDSCLAAAAYMEPGLDERPLAADLLGRDDLTGASLSPWGRSIAEGVRGFVSLQGFLLPALRSAVGEGEYAWTVDSLGDLLGRVTGVLESVDFLDDAVSWSERRAGGLVQYECTRVQLKPAAEKAAVEADPLVVR